MSAQKSPRAFAHYRELVEGANKKPVVISNSVHFTEAEMTWDRLSSLEAQAFLIEPTLLNALIFAHIRYQDLIGQTDIEFSEFREEERAAFPEFFKRDLHYSLDDAAGFMATACEVPFTQALMWVCRTQVQLHRSGLFHDDLMPPAWAISNLGDTAVTDSVSREYPEPLF